MNVQLKQNNFIKYVMMALIALVVSFTTLGAFADSASAARLNSTTTEDNSSQARLREEVDEKIADKTYTSETGDTIKGSALVKNGITTSEFERLTSKEKQRLINDMTTVVQNKQQKDIENDSNNPVTDDTVTNWLQELQQQPGVGSRLLQDITEQIKPDYVSGNRIFEPFAGPINTTIAVIIIVAMAGLVLTFVMDLAYLNFPFFQSLVANHMNNNGGGGGNSGRFTNFFVGREALQAVEEAENNSNGKYKNPNGLYLKKRFIGVALFGLCLLYLVQGQIFQLVGMLMDLLGGFLE